MPFCGVLQAMSATWYFRHTTPKKQDPGFMSMGDVGRLSWVFVSENIFYSLILWFQYCYFHPTLFGLDGQGKTTGTVWKVSLTVIEVACVFLPYWWRPLFPKTALRES